MAGSPAGQPRWGARPVRLSAQREQPFKRESLRGSERASPAGGQDVRDPTTLVARAGTNNNIVNSSQAL
jgi:hypothetical protein